MKTSSEIYLIEAYSEALVSKVSQETTEWAILNAERNGLLGKVLNSAFHLGSNDVAACPNSTILLASSAALTALQGTPYLDMEYGSTGWKPKDYTKLLITGTGTNGSQVITDSCGKPVTVSGNTNISTTQSVIGGSSIYFDGSGDYLSLADSSDWEPPVDKKLTIDFWMNLSSNSATKACEILSRRNGDVYCPYALRMNTNNKFEVLISFDNSNWANLPTLTTVSTLSLSTWYHIALVIDGSSFYLFVNGVAVSTYTSGSAFTDSNNLLYIGGFSTGYSEYFNGYLSHIRIKKGQALWTSNFTPPSTLSDYFETTRTYELLDVGPAPSDVLLITGNGTHGSQIITDSGGKAVTVYGNTSISTAQSKIGGSSIYFDGTGDYLSLADSGDWDFGSGDFTIDFWVNASNNRFGIIEQHQDSNNFWTIFAYDNLIYFRIQTGGSTTLYFSVPITLNGAGWKHVAIVRNGNTWYCYNTGIELTKTLDSGAYTASMLSLSAVLKISLYAETNLYLSGYLAYIRITKGLARTFTPSTLPTRISDYLKIGGGLA